MDDTTFRGAEMKSLLKDLELVNKWLGGNKITINGIKKLLKGHPQQNSIIIVDIGCGDGELLRKCAEFGRKSNNNFELIGIDFNENILDIARQKSIGYSNIEFRKVDVFLEENLIPNCDIALCTLFLHHFSDTKIEQLLKIILEKSSIGVIVNDLHRNKMAFNLFKMFSKLFLTSKTAAHDGLISITKGFKKNELETFSKRIVNQHSILHWRWAFRYQWILKKLV